MDEAQRAAWVVRQPPPAATLAWLVVELDACAVVAVSPMRGGSTAAMHRVTLIDRGDHQRVVVLRRYVRPEILTESPDVAAVEGRALQLAERLLVPTPALLALDATGERADVPALAMSLLDGRPVWETRWGSRWVSQAVDAMIALHDVDASQAKLPTLTAYAQNATTHHDGRPILHCGSEPSSCSTARHRPAMSGSFTVISTRQRALDSRSAARSF